jgi:hypothetical protein
LGAKKRITQQVEQDVEAGIQKIVKELWMGVAHVPFNVNEEASKDLWKKGSVVSQSRFEPSGEIRTFYATNVKTFLACKQWWPLERMDY